MKEANAYSVNTMAFEEAIKGMDASRRKMYDAIIALRDLNKQLGEIWEGDDKDAFVIGFDKTIKEMYTEEKRLNAVAWQMGQYLTELKEAEKAAKNAASSVTN